MGEKKTAETQEIDFESTLKKLESLVDRLEQTDTPLEESLSAFEQGIALTREAQKSLSAAEQRVQMLTQVDGEPVASEFSEGETGE